MWKKLFGLYHFKYVLGITLLAVITTVFLSDADAVEDYRYGTLSWKWLSNNEVEFYGSQAWKSTGSGGTGPSGSAVVGDIISVPKLLEFGDGQSTSFFIKVTEINPTEDWFVGNIVNNSGDPISHTYAGNGPFIVSWSTYPDVFVFRIDGLGNSNLWMRMETIVDLSSGNSAPVTTTPQIINVNADPTDPDPVKATATFAVPASDSDGDTLRWRLANGEVITGVDVTGNGNFIHPSGISIDPGTGMVTWDTTGLIVGRLYDTAVTIEDLDSNDIVNANAKSKISVDFLLKIMPNTPPVAQCQDVTIDADATCKANVDVDDVNNGSFDPDGDPITLSLSPKGPFELGQTPVTLTVTEVDSGEYSQCTSTVTVEDNTVPSLFLPADTTVECGDDTSPASNGTATGDDNCNIFEVTHSDTTVTGCGNTEVITRTWTVTDLAGNWVSGDQTITVVDTTAPLLSGVPADVTVECDNIPAPASPVATDKCDVNPVISFSESRIDGDCPGNYMLTRTWTATDDCGNSTSGTQTITVVDTTAPLIVCPADVTLEYPADTGVATNGSATGSDTCGGVKITFNDSSVSGPGNNVVITRTWTATDDCGNSTSCDQTITVNDTSVLVLSGVPDDVTVECDRVPVPASPTATSNCSKPNITFSEIRTDGDCPGNYTLTRTWSATDECNNVISQTQIITVQDTTAPVVKAMLVPVKVKKRYGCFRVEFSAKDNCDDVADLSAVLNGHPVKNGELVRLFRKNLYRIKVNGRSDDGSIDSSDGNSNGGHRCSIVKFKGPDFTLVVTAIDNCGNESTGTYTYVFDDNSRDLHKKKCKKCRWKWKWKCKGHDDDSIKNSHYKKYWKKWKKWKRNKEEIGNHSDSEDTGD